MNVCTPPHQQIVITTPPTPSRVRDGVRTTTRTNLLGAFEAASSPEQMFEEESSPTEPLERIRRMREDLGTEFDRVLSEEAKYEIYYNAVFGESDEIKDEALQLLFLSFLASDSVVPKIYVPQDSLVVKFYLPFRQV